MAYPTNGNVLVVYNSSTTANGNYSDITQSKDIADYAEATFVGCHKIGIPIVDGIRSGTYGENISRADYETYIRDVIRTEIASGGWTIYYIVLCKGIPHRIAGSGTTYSSVDCELCTLEDDFNGVYDPSTLSYNSGANPYYNYLLISELCQLFVPGTYTNTVFSGDGVSYLVTRLDGYTVAQVKAMIDKAANSFVAGGAWYVFDDDPTKGYDQMGQARTRLDALGENNDYDNTNVFITTASGDVIAYVGHGIHHNVAPPSGATYIIDDLNFTLKNGAICTAYESYFCWSFGKHDGTASGRNGQGQISDWIQIGGSGGCGYCYEPYQSGIAHEEIFMKAFVAGFPLADAFFLSLYWMSWVSVVIGWPLMRIATLIDAAPAAPQNIALTRVLNTIIVTWDANTECDLAGYKVYWDTNSGVPYANSKNVGNVLTYNIVDAHPILTTYIAGSAYDAAAQESCKSEEIKNNPLGDALMGRLHSQGTALVGGDASGNDRGANSIDIQTSRNALTQVASGAQNIAIGYRNTAAGDSENFAIGRDNTVSCYNDGLAIGTDNTISSGNHNAAIGFDNQASNSFSTAVGYSNTASEYNTSAMGNRNTASGRYSSALGYNNTSSGEYSSAIGNTCTASAYYSTAFGYKAKARIQKTTNICGPQIIRKDDGEAAGAAFESFCGVEVVLMTKEVDLKVVAEQTITLPSGCKFWLDEIGLIATSIDTLTVQPTIRFGITGTLDKHYTAAITTAITAAGKREIETPLVPEDGETSLTAGVTVAATATTALGRFYFKGILCENE